MKKSLLVLNLFIALSFAALSAQAQAPVFAQIPTIEPKPAAVALSRTVTRTEAQVNSSFRVTNPLRTRITNRYLDLQPGQVMLTATITTRAASGRATTTLNSSATYMPAVTNGRITWMLTSATIDGAPATTEQISTINMLLGESWRAFVVALDGSGRVTAVTVTDNDITVTLN